MAQQQYRNLVLRNLSEDVLDRLELRPTNLELKRVLESTGHRVEQVVFFEEGIGSMTTIFQDGSQVETGMFGRESVLGTWALLGLRTSPNRVMVQVPGHGFVCSIEAAQREFRRCQEFQRLALRFAASQTVQAVQTAGCNARHNVQQRLSRWLLQCRDRVSSDVLHLTQEFMAAMLGVERPAVSIVAVRLQDRGLIEYTRGRVRIANRQGLESLSCECYWVTRRELEAFAAFAETTQQVSPT